MGRATTGIPLIGAAQHRSGENIVLSCGLPGCRQHGARQQCHSHRIAISPTQLIHHHPSSSSLAYVIRACRACLSLPLLTSANYLFIMPAARAFKWRNNRSMPPAARLLPPHHIYLPASCLSLTTHLYAYASSWYRRASCRNRYSYHQQHICLNSSRYEFATRTTNFPGGPGARRYDAWERETRGRDTEADAAGDARRFRTSTFPLCIIARENGGGALNRW